MARIALCSILHYQMQYSSCIIALCLPWRIYLAMAAYMAFHNKEMGILCITKLFYYSIKKGCVTMPLPQREDYTIEDIYALPEGTRAELIDGQIYYMAPPTRKHQDIVGALYRKIADYIDSKGGSCKTYVSPFAVFLNENDKNYVEPDISVTCDPNKLNDKGCTGAPDWIVEIVSPGSRRMDYFTKLFKYRTAGVREYWIVDPLKNFVIVYNFDTSDSEQYTFADTIKAGIYEDLHIDFSKIDF